MDKSYAPRLEHKNPDTPWVDAELLRYEIDCLDSSLRLKTHLGFEFRQVCCASSFLS